VTDHQTDPDQDPLGPTGSIESAGTPPPTTIGPTTFQTRTGGIELVRIGAVVLAGLAIVVTAVVAAGAARNADPTAVLGAGASPTASAGASDKVPGRPGIDRWLKRGTPWQQGRGLGQAFGRITISAIEGNALSLKTDDGWTRTIAVTSSTTVTKGGANASAGDLAVGDTIRFRETRNADGTFAITTIEVVLPRTAGTISNVSETTFTLTDRDGVAWTVTLTDSTKYWLANATGTRSDVKAGMTALVIGATASGNKITATQIAVQIPRVVGEVTAKQGNTITIRTRDGDTVTVHVSGTTRFQIARNGDAKLADVTLGMTIMVGGTKQADGSYDAVEVAGGLTFHGPIKIPPLRPNATPSPAS
jgi:hypothetical protein